VKVNHDLQHALSAKTSGCRCNMSDITNCVICEKKLMMLRDEVDTCPGACTKRLLELQRQGLP